MSSLLSFLFVYQIGAGSVQFFPEVTVRFQAGKIARRKGRTYLGLQRRCIDLLALIQPHYRIYEPLAVGIEIKVSEHDLMGDNKFFDYLDYCHYFFLAVQPSLETTALFKLDDFHKIGLLLIEPEEPGQSSIRISKEPERNDVVDAYLLGLYQSYLPNVLKASSPILRGKPHQTKKVQQHKDDESTVPTQSRRYPHELEDW